MGSLAGHAPGGRQVLGDGGVGGRSRGWGVTFCFIVRLDALV